MSRLMSKCLENCWWLCNANRNYILTHLINVYKSIKLSWKWVKTRKQILLFHWRCRNFNTPSLVKPSTKIGNSLRRFKHSNNSHATLNIFETAVDTEKFAPGKMFARNRAIRQFFCFSIPFFVLELYAIKVQGLFGFRRQKTRGYLKGRGNYSSTAFNECRISDDCWSFTRISMSIIPRRIIWSLTETIY